MNTWPRTANRDPSPNDNIIATPNVGIVDGANDEAPLKQDTQQSKTEDVATSTPPTPTLEPTAETVSRPPAPAPSPPPSPPSAYMLEWTSHAATYNDATQIGWARKCTFGSPEELRGAIYIATVMSASGSGRIPKAESMSRVAEQAELPSRSSSVYSDQQPSPSQPQNLRRLFVIQMENPSSACTDYTKIVCGTLGVDTGFLQAHAEQGAFRLSPSVLRRNLSMMRGKKAFRDEVRTRNSVLEVGRTTPLFVCWEYPQLLLCTQNKHGQEVTKNTKRKGPDEDVPKVPLDDMATSSPDELPGNMDDAGKLMDGTRKLNSTPVQRMSYMKGEKNMWDISGPSTGRDKIDKYKEAWTVEAVFCRASL